MLYKLLYLLVALTITTLAAAQKPYLSYEVLKPGDTINIVDGKNLKQKKWVIQVPELRGEPAYEEEGKFKDGKKIGTWRKFSTEGDVLAVENYVAGTKDGLQQYFTQFGKLVFQESWKGYDPEHPYDTIPIYGTATNEILNYKVVPAEPYAVKHGVWKYFDPQTGRLIKEEEWFLNRYVDPTQKNKTVVQDSSAQKQPVKKEVTKTPEMLKWDKKNKGKKKALRDGETH